MIKVLHDSLKADVTHVYAL